MDVAKNEPRNRRAMNNVAESIDSEALIQEALDNFAALIDGLDFSVELEIMGIGRLQFLRRKRMLVELCGLYIALWRLALGRSFPNDADRMFKKFLENYAQSHPSKIGAHTAQRALEYWGMLEPTGDADFHGVARHLTSFIVLENQDPRAIILKLALHIRKAYRFIFERLI